MRVNRPGRIVNGSPFTFKSASEPSSDLSEALGWAPNVSAQRTRVFLLRAEMPGDYGAFLKRQNA